MSSLGMYNSAMVVLVHVIYRSSRRQTLHRDGLMGLFVGLVGLFVGLVHAYRSFRRQTLHRDGAEGAVRRRYSV